MNELDFSDEACLERYVEFTNCDEENGELFWMEDLAQDDPVIISLKQYKRVPVDWDLLETTRPVKHFRAPEWGRLAA